MAYADPVFRSGESQAYAASYVRFPPPPLGSKDVADMVLVLDDTDAGQGWLAIPIGLTRKSRNSCAVPVTLYVSHTNLLPFLFLSFFAIASLPNS